MNGEPANGVTVKDENCIHEWVHSQQTKEKDTYYHIWQVTNILTCKHCREVLIQSVYEVPEQCAPWMPLDDA